MHDTCFWPSRAIICMYLKAASFKGTVCKTDALLKRDVCKRRCVPHVYHVELCSASLFTDKTVKYCMLKLDPKCLTNFQLYTRNFYLNTLKNTIQCSRHTVFYISYDIIKNLPNLLYLCQKIVSFFRNCQISFCNVNYLKIAKLFQKKSILKQIY